VNITFSEQVLNVDISDFTLTADTGTGAQSVSLTGLTVGGSGSSYSLDLSTVTATAGSYVLTLNPSDITDTTGNALVAGASDTFVIDRTAPTGVALLRASANPSTASSVNFTVAFSEAVTGVDATDFTLTGTAATGASIGTVTKLSDSLYTVAVNTITGDGTLGLDLNSSSTGITDVAGNAISGGLTGQLYTIDNTAPTVTAINRNDAAIISGGSASFTVSFSEAVTGVDASDFTLDLSGVTTTNGDSDISITGSGSTYTVTVANVSGTGTLSVDLKSTGTAIADVAANAIATGFTTGDLYTRDITNPTVTASQAFNLPENMSNGFVIGQVKASDTNGVASYSITSGNTDGFFAIDANGVLTLTPAGAVAKVASSDYETLPNAFTLGITATDVAGNTSTSASVTITVLNEQDNSKPTLTAISNVTGGTEDTQQEITFAALTGLADEADSDGTVDAFVVKVVSTGTLKIGAAAGTATAWDADTNAVVDIIHNAYWTPASNANGNLNAFTVVAKDDFGAESITPVQVVVATAAVNDAPTVSIKSVILLSFAAKADYATGTGPFSVSSADLNGDGYADLIVANYSGNTVSVLTGKGDGTFDSKVDYATGSFPNSVTIADVNKDGKADLVVANYFSNTASVLTGKGDGTFDSKVDYATGSFPNSVTIADVNKDGKADLIVSNGDDNTVSVLTGKGDGTFDSKVDYATGSLPQSVTSADVNGDGNIDLIVANQNSHTVSVLTGKGDGTFNTMTVYATGISPISVRSADVTGDGKTDLMVANYSGNSVSVLIGKEDGTFYPKVDYATGAYPQSVTSADVNGDGNTDLIVANSGGGTVSVLTGNGDGTFTAKSDYATGAGAIFVTSADVNGDGKADLIVANYSDKTVSLLLNTTQPPQPPLTPFTEQTPVAASSSVAINDLDGDADWNGGTLRVQITANNEAADSLSLSTTSSPTGIWLDTIGNKVMSGMTGIGTADAASVSNGTAWTLTFNASATNALVQAVAQEVTFNNSSDTPGTSDRSITFTATDKANGFASATQILTVTAVNDAPTAADATLTTNEDTALVLTAASFGFSDVDGDALTTVKITTLPTAGTLKYGTAVVTVDQKITKADIDAGKLEFTPAANANGAGYATIGFKVSDGTDYSAVANTLTVDVTAVNDAPVLDLDGDNSSTATGSSVLSGASYHAEFIVRGSAVAIADTDITITDVDQTDNTHPDTIDHATVAITAGAMDNLFDTIYETLTTDQTSVTSSLGGTITISGTGTTDITITGTGTWVEYQDIIKAIKYQNSNFSAFPGDRTITVTMTDSAITEPAKPATVTATATINNVWAPAVDTNGVAAGIT